MRIPLHWLSDYVELTRSPEDLAELLTAAGLEVTRIDRLGVEGADLVWDRDQVVLAQLVEVEAHPDADRLVLAKVDYGGADLKVVVTGAPNLVPYLGTGDLREAALFSPLLLEGGTYLDPYKDGKPTRLKGKKLRGVYNDAMLCSAVELGLGDDREGILLIEEGDLPAGHMAGAALQDVLGDVVLDIDIIPNVARCASMVGVAREVAALTGAELRLPDCEVTMEGEPLGDRILLSTDSPELNPRFVALLIEDVEHKPAPFWMQHRLRLAGQRPIDVIVDVSNYVMLELGQPNHSFDFDFLRRRAAKYGAAGDDGKGSVVHIHTRLARDGETLTTLDGEERKLLGNNMLVTDPAGALSLAGVMGGADSEIRPETTRVLLEAAAWNYINIRHTSRQHTLLTDAAFRFSRGVHPSQALLGAKRAAELLRRLAGGRVADGIVDYYPQPAPTVSIQLEPKYVRELSGLTLDGAEIKSLLERLAFRVEKEGLVEEEGEALRVTAPDHRMDIEGPHDLVEEICRMYGYDRIPSTIIADELPPQRGNPRLEKEELIRDLLVQQGLQEVVTYRLTTAEADARAGDTKTGPEESYVRLINPTTVDRVVMRHSLLASVLEIAAANSRFQSRICLFELGRVYPRPPGEALPEPSLQLVVVMTGMRGAVHWQTGAGGWLGFYDLKGVLEGLAQGLKVTWSYAEGGHPSLRPGATARLSSAEGGEIGHAGELHPEVVERYDLRLEDEQSLFIAVLDLDTLMADIPELFSVEAVPSYPAIHEDLALIVDRDTPAARLEEVMYKAGGRLLRNLELFDVYEGEGIRTGAKSLAYHLTLQSDDRTLEDRDAEKTRRRILRVAEAELGARLRES